MSERQLTDNAIQDDSPIITPNGRYVAFRRKTGTGHKIISMRAKMRGAVAEEERTSELRIFPPLSITKKLAIENYKVCFTVATSGNHTEVFTTTLLDTIDQQQITNSPAGRAAFEGFMNPKGEDFTYINTQDPAGMPGLTWEIFYQDNGNPPSTITNDDIRQEAPVIDNRRHIVYLENETVLPGGGSSGGGTIDEIAQWDIIFDRTPDDGTGGPKRNIGTMRLQRVELPAGSPILGSYVGGTRKLSINRNGRRIAYTSDWNLSVISRDGGPPVTNEIVSDKMVFDFNISQNGKWIAFSARDDLLSPAKVYRIKSDGTDETMISPAGDTPDDTSPSIKNNGRKIVFVRDMASSKEIILARVLT